MMKLRLVVFLCIIALAGTALAAKKTTITTKKDKTSYALGVDMAQRLKKNDIDVNPEVFFQGIKDGLSGGKLLMPQNEIMDSLRSLQLELQAKYQEKMKAAEKKAADFLAVNKTKKGVKTLKSGLQYKIIRKGSGRKPNATDSVTVNYRGSLIDGTVFDSSYKRGKPATFHVNGVIPGWTEALQMMKEGAKWELFIPPNLGYGMRGAPGIPPNSVLIFEVELISVNK